MDPRLLDYIEENLTRWKKMLESKELTQAQYDSLLKGEEDIKQMKGE